MILKISRRTQNVKYLTNNVRCKYSCDLRGLSIGTYRTGNENEAIDMSILTEKYYVQPSKQNFSITTKCTKNNKHFSNGAPSGTHQFAVGIDFSIR